MIKNKVIYMGIKNFIGDIFGFNKQIYYDETNNITYENLHSINQQKIQQLETALNQEENKVAGYQSRVNQLVNEINILNEELSIKPSQTIFNPELPEPFLEHSNIYKAGWVVYTKENNVHREYRRQVKLGGEHLALTPMLQEILDKANIQHNNNAKTVFDKILGVIQTNFTYMYDQDLWGKLENWTPANTVMTVGKSDCESVSALTISAFEYFRLKTGKFMDVYPFIGCGLYSNLYGHAFPCLYIPGDNFEEDLFVGEATLSNSIPTRPLKLCKNAYWFNWGNHSFWHDFVFKKENIHWEPSRNRYGRDVGMNTGEKVEEDFIVHDKKEFKKKKKAIEDFWKEK
jgi:hypothetical protein